MTVQPFSPLDADTEAALRESIRRFGVVVPIVVDGHGRIIDGHHRERIARELGITSVPQVKRAVKNDDDATALAYTLNADRRHLTAEQRREIVADLRSQGYSLRAIAGVTKVSQTQTRRDVAKTEAQVSPPGSPATPDGVDPATGEITGEPNQAAEGGAEPKANGSPAPKVKGKDGKSYPAKKPKPVDPDVGYRATASRFVKQTTEGVLSLDPERWVTTTLPADRAALGSFADSIHQLALDLRAELKKSSTLKAVQ